MASIAVPDLYGKSILEEDLAVKQSRAQAEIQCRQQLSLSHTLVPNVLTEDYSSSQVGRGVRSHIGRRGIAQELEIQANGSTCNAFSMRAYVGSIRELDVNKCWPFPSHLMKRRMEESPHALLPALKVPRYKYWECSECVDNCPHYVSSYENQIAEQHTDDSIHDKPCTTDKAESLAKLPKNDPAFLVSVMQNPVSVSVSFDTSPKEEAGQEMPVDIHSVESSFENDKEVCRNGDDVVSNSPMETDDSIHDTPFIKGEATSFSKIPKNECTVLGPYLVPISANTFGEETIDNTEDSTPTDISSGKSSFENDKEVHNGDDVVQRSPMEHLTSQKISEDDRLYSINETIACNVTLWPTYSKVNSDATQTFCTNNEDQVFANQTWNHIRTESEMSDFIPKEEHLSHISGTVKSVAICNPVEKIFNEDDHEISAEREQEEIIKDTPGNHTLTTSIADGDDKEDYITEDCQVSAVKEKEKSVTETPGNNTFVSSITDEDYKEDCIGPNHRASAQKEKEQSMDETPGNNTLASSIVDDVHKEDCIAQNHRASANKEKEHSIDGKPGNNTLASSIVDDVHKEDWNTQVSTVGRNDGILTKENNHSAKRQKGKGKILKKRLISDLIAVTPFEQLECNEESWNCKAKSMSRQARIGRPKKDITRTWGVSKAAAYRVRKFKENSNYSSTVREKPDLGSVKIKRKPQCFDVSYQSAASAKSLEEARSTVKRRFRSKKCQRSSEELLSKSSSKQALENGTERELHIDQDEDVLNDLASFMAKNQYERHARKFCNLEESECPGATILHSKNSECEDIHNVASEKSQQLSNPFHVHNNNSEPQDINKVVSVKSVQSSDPVQLHENDSLELVKGRDNSRYNSTPYSSIAGQVHVLVEDSPEANQAQEPVIPVEDRPEAIRVQEPVMPEKPEMSGSAIKEAEVIFQTKKAINLSAYHHACKNSEKGDLDKDANTERVNHKRSLVDASMMKTRNVSGVRPFQRKNTTIKKSIHRLKKLMKSSHDQLSLIEQTNAALNAALHNVRSQSVHVPVGACKDAQTVAGTSFSPVQTNSAEIFVHSQTVARPVLAPTVSQTRPTTLNVLPNLANPKSSNAKTTQLPQTVVGTSFSPVQTNSAEIFVHSQTVAHPVLTPTVFQMRPTALNVLPNLANPKSSNAKATQLPQTEGSSKGQRVDAALASRHKPQESMQQPTLRDGVPFLHPMMRSTDKDFMFEGTKSTTGQANDNEGTQKPDTRMAQPPAIGSFPVSGVSGPQFVSILTGIPVINFPVENKAKDLSNGNMFQPPPGEILSYFALKGPSSMIAEQSAEAAMCRDYCQPLRSPVILSFALGNKLDTETTLSQEFFDQGKSDLQSYIQRRIEIHYPSRASKSSTNEAVRDSEMKESQSANHNPVDVMDFENCVTNKKQVRYGQNNAVFFMNTEQTDALSQNMNTGLDYADGQSCKRKQGTEASQLPTDNQVTVFGENLHATLQSRVTNKTQVGFGQNNAVADQQRIKIVKVKQVQEGSNTFPQISLPLLQTDALRRILHPGLEIAKGQNCNGNSTEHGEAPTDKVGENLNPDMENSVTNRKHAAYRQKNAALLMNTNQQHIKNIKVEQVQTNSNIFPPISLPLLHADGLSRNLGTGLEIADGQNHKRKAGTEASQALEDNQVTVLGHNLPTTLENGVKNKKHVGYAQNNAVLLMNAHQHHIKNGKAKQVQAESNTFPPISLPLLQNDALRRNLDTDLEIADVQNYNRKGVTETSGAPTDNQSTGLGENLNVTVENRVRNKDYAGRSQNNDVLFMNAGQHHIKNANVKQVQADSTIFPPIISLALQTDAFRRNVDSSSMKVARRRNCKRKRGAKSRLIPIDNQAPVPGENLNSNLESKETEIHIGNKIIRCKLVQLSSQTSKPITMTDALGERNSMLQRTLGSGKLTESSNIVNNKAAYIPVGKRGKYVKETKGAAAQTKIEAQSHCMQTPTSRAENYIAQGNVNPYSQPVYSRALERAQHFAGSQHVLKPIAQNTQQLVPVPSVAFQRDQQDKMGMEEILNTVQGSSQTAKPITMTVAPGEGDSMLQKDLRSGKVTESSNIVISKPTCTPVAKLRRIMKKAKEAIAQKKPEAESHCIQTETCAAENYTTQGNVDPSSQAVTSRRPESVQHFAGFQHVPQSKLETESHCVQTEACAAENCTTQSNVSKPSSQAVASRGSEPVKHFAGSQHVPRPIAQNRQQLLFVPPVPCGADIRDKMEMENILNTVQESTEAPKAITVTDELGGDFILQSAPRRGNLMESSNAVNNMPANIPALNRRKYVEKAEREARAQRKREKQSVLHSSSHAVASTGSESVIYRAGSQPALEPITQQTQQLLSVPPVPFLADQQDNVAAEQSSRRKTRGKIPLKPNIFDRAIEDYIKWGIVSVLPLPPQTLPSKVVEPMKLDAGLPLESRTEYYAKFVNPMYNPPTVGVQPNNNAPENHVFVDVSTTGNIAVAPSAGNSNIAFSACTGIMPCNMMPTRPTVTPEMQAYLDRFKINFFSFAHTDSTVAALNDFQSEPNITSQSGVPQVIQKQRRDEVALSSTVDNNPVQKVLSDCPFKEETIYLQNEQKST